MENHRFCTAGNPVEHRPDCATPIVVAGDRRRRKSSPQEIVGRKSSARIVCAIARDKKPCHSLAENLVIPTEGGAKAMPKWRNLLFRLNLGS
jgi:hypothetical protein